MNRSHLRVSRIIAPTIQGEGPYAGTRVALIRLAGCNLSCAACDEPQTWKSEPVESFVMTADEILDKIREAGNASHRIMNVMITGGEPLLQQRNGLRDLVQRTLSSYRSVHIETNGTIMPDMWLQTLMRQRPGKTNVVVSPKVSGPLASNSQRQRLRYPAIATFAAGRAAFKFVCSTIDDLRLVVDFVEQSKIRRRDVWIMGEGATLECSNESLAKIATMAVVEGFNLSGRLHLAAWQGGE